MTALVSILNKKAAVLAADSAVTISKDGKTRIYNTANKIFRLSDNKPVGVMIYDTSQFMNTPWDVLFKLYRDRRSNK
jgi:ATP-dependent protease HslVU (ClpYQ) peptidase subunit